MRSGQADCFADGNVITPWHNPPENGGFKYMVPNGVANNFDGQWFEFPLDANYTFVNERVATHYGVDARADGRAPLQPALPTAIS